MDVDSNLVAVEAFVEARDRAGGNSALARICGCTPANIGQLLGKGSLLSAEYVLPVEAATGVSRHDLRLDLYPREGCHAEPCPEHGRPSASNPREGSPRVSPAGRGREPVGGSAPRDALEGARA